MDDTPFLTIDLLNMKDRDFTELKKFTKDALDIDSILNTAEELKYSRLIKEWFTKELEDPSPEFVKVILNRVYEGTKNQKVMDKFTPLVKRSILQYINDSMNMKIKSALSKENDDEIKSVEESSGLDNAEESVVRKIDTTIEELEAYAIVKSILRTTVNCERINYRDTESYFGILLDDNNRKWVCRIHLMQSIKYITVADENKKPVRYDINNIDDIYNYAEEITESCKRYL